MTEAALRIVIPAEQRSELGRVLPCEYAFDVESCPLDESIWEHDGCVTGWHIVPVTFKVERLEPGDRMALHIDMDLIDRVIHAAEVLSAGPFQS